MAQLGAVAAATLLHDEVAVPIGLVGDACGDLARRAGGDRGPCVGVRAEEDVDYEEDEEGLTLLPRSSQRWACQP